MGFPPLTTVKCQSHFSVRFGGHMPVIAHASGLQTSPSVMSGFLTGGHTVFTLSCLRDRGAEGRRFCSCFNISALYGRRRRPARVSVRARHTCPWDRHCLSRHLFLMSRGLGIHGCNRADDWPSSPKGVMRVSCVCLLTFLYVREDALGTTGPPAARFCFPSDTEKLQVF